MNYDVLATKEAVDKTAKSLQEKGYNVFILDNKSEALEKIKTLIPKDASVMSGASVTLEQIGYAEYLKSGIHGWKDLRREVFAENDPEKRTILRKKATLSDYYLGSVNAMTETGEAVIASNTGSQLPHIVFNSPSLVFVVGTQKIVPTLENAMKRLEEYVVPLEDEHMKKLYGVGTRLSKIVILKQEPPILGRKIYFLLVNEKLGF